jgi:hypothetical protein
VALGEDHFADISRYLSHLSVLFSNISLFAEVFFDDRSFRSHDQTIVRSADPNGLFISFLFHSNLREEVNWETHHT